MSNAFISQMMPHALRVSQATGIDPRIVIAQSALETGWGKSAPGSNYFGIKSHGKPGGNTFATKEVVNGQTIGINDSFRAYGGMGQSADDYAAFLQNNPRYRPMLEAQGIDAQIEALGRSGYATDPQYANKVRAIASGIDMDNLPPVSAAPPLMGGQGSDTLQARASTQGAPMGLLDSFQQQEEPQRFGDKLRASAADGSLWDGLALAANSLRRRPDDGLAQMISQRQESREGAKRLNRTVEWMRGNGFGDLAGAVESGALSPQQAIAMVMQQPEDNRTALMQNYEYALSQGMSPEEARQWVSGGTNVNVNTGPNGIDYGDPGDGRAWLRNPDGTVKLDERGLPMAGAFQGGSAWEKSQQADAEAVAADTARALGRENTQSRAGVVLSNIDAVRGKVENSILPVTGAIGSLVKQIPGTNAYDVSALTTTIRANIGFDRLQQMRDESPTGGALGQVAVQELEALQASLGNLDQAQSEEQFLAALDAVERQYSEIMRKASQYPNAADYGFATLPPADNGGISSDPLGLFQ